MTVLFPSSSCYLELWNLSLVFAPGDKDTCKRFGGKMECQGRIDSGNCHVERRFSFHSGGCVELDFEGEKVLGSEK